MQANLYYGESLSFCAGPLNFKFFLFFKYPLVLFVPYLVCSFPFYIVCSKPKEKLVCIQSTLVANLECISIVPWQSLQLAACHHIHLVSVKLLLENEHAPVLEDVGKFLG